MNIKKLHKENTALDIDKNFSELGSFWIRQMKGKDREQASILSSLSLYNNLNTDIFNVYNNLNNIPNIYATNKAFRVYKIGEDTNGKFLEFEEDINIDIKTLSFLNPSNKDTKTLFYNILDFYRLKNDPKKIYITNTSIADNINVNDIVNIYGTYNENATEMISLYNSLADTSSVRVGINASMITSYVGGCAQSPKDFENFLNAYLGCHFVNKSDIVKSIADNKIICENTVYIIDYNEGQFEEGSNIYQNQCLDPIVSIEANISTLTIKIKSYYTSKEELIKNLVNKFAPVGYLITYSIN